jgi:hypothetical protein
MRGMDGAAGFVSPWIEAQALDGEGLPLPTGQEGALRVRRRDRLVPLGRQPDEDDEADQSHAGWVHLRQRGKIANNVLTITGAHPN